MSTYWLLFVVFGGLDLGMLLVLLPGWLLNLRDRIWPRELTPVSYANVETMLMTGDHE